MAVPQGAADVWGPLFGAQGAGRGLGPGPA